MDLKSILKLKINLKKVVLNENLLNKDLLQFYRGLNCVIFYTNKA